MPFRAYIYETSSSGGAGMVTGYFECKTVIATNYYEGLVKGSCLTLQQMINYADNKVLCGLLIGKVVKFKKPMPVSYFGFKRPPQSWQYIYHNVSNDLLYAAIKQYKLKNIDGMTCLDIIDKIQYKIKSQGGNKQCNT